MFGILNFGNWDLYGIWCLWFGILIDRLFFYSLSPLVGFLQGVARGPVAGIGSKGFRWRGNCKGHPPDPETGSKVREILNRCD